MTSPLSPHDSGDPAEREQQWPGQRDCEGHSARLQECGSQGLGHWGGRDGGRGAAQGSAPPLTLALPRPLSEPLSLLRVDSSHFWGPSSSEVFGAAGYVLLFSSSSPPRRSGALPDLRVLPHCPLPPRSPPPAQSLNPHPPSALPWDEGGFLWEPGGLLQPPSLFFLLFFSPSFLPFILKIALPLQPFPPTHPLAARSVS